MTLQRRSRGDQAWTQTSNTLTQEQYVPAVGCKSFPGWVVSLLRVRLLVDEWNVAREPSSIGATRSALSPLASRRSHRGGRGLGAAFPLPGPALFTPRGGGRRSAE